MKKISRRNFLRVAGLAAATGMMTACGGSNSTASAGSTASGAAASSWPDGDVTIYVPQVQAEAPTPSSASLWNA